MQLAHYYVQKGFYWDDIIGATNDEKRFLRASMVLAIEERNAMFGGGNNSKK